MSAKIKLRREGAKKNPCYKIVVIDSRKPGEGRFIDMLGYYHPTQDPYVLNINVEDSVKWVKQGVKMTKTVESLFKQEGIFEKAKES